MDNLPYHFDALSEHDKLLVKSFIYLRANHLCLHCHKPADEIDVYIDNIDLSVNSGFCNVCVMSDMSTCDLVVVK